MKLWKITANGAGWSSAETFYFDSKERAEKFNRDILDSGKCSDGVEYAGNYKPENAKELLSMTEKEL
jgi:hypothetical protein